MTDISDNRQLFKHEHTITVRNYEIDWQGIVHNGNYLLYFEVARVEYFKDIGLEVDERTIAGSVRIVLVRNELDFIHSATFGDKLTVLTRISSIKNSSFICDAEMLHREKDVVIARNRAVMVWTDPKTGKSTPVPATFRTLVHNFEGNNAVIHWPSVDV